MDSTYDWAVKECPLWRGRQPDRQKTAARYARCPKHSKPWGPLPGLEPAPWGLDLSAL